MRVREGETITNVSEMRDPAAEQPADDTPSTDDTPSMDDAATPEARTHTADDSRTRTAPQREHDGVYVHAPDTAEVTDDPTVNGHPAEEQPAGDQTTSSDDTPVYAADSAVETAAETTEDTGAAGDTAATERSSASGIGAEHAGASTITTGLNSSGQRRPKAVTMRVNRASLLACLAIAACATPIADMAGGPAPVIYLVPVLLTVWILRTATVVDSRGMTVRTMFTTRRIGWDDVHSLRLDERRWVRAVLGSEQQVRLSAVRVRDVPKLALMSGGRLPNPEAQE